MPTQEDPPPQPATVEDADDHRDYEKLLCSYLGLSFAVFLGLIPKSSISLVSTLQSRNRVLFLKLLEAEEQLRQLHSRRKEDSKANARVVEIFASQRHAWQQDEKRLLQQIAAGAEEIAHLRARVEELEKTDAELRQSLEELRREVGERDEMLNFMTRRSEFEDSSHGGGGGGVSSVSGFVGDYRSEGPRFGKIRAPECLDPVAEESFWEREGQNVEEMGALYGQSNGFSPELLNSASKFWAEKANLWQLESVHIWKREVCEACKPIGLCCDMSFIFEKGRGVFGAERSRVELIERDVQYEPVESLYQLKHFVARRESPWKVDGESTGVSAKLKLLEQELLNLERIGKSDLSKVPSQMRKQAKRYQALTGKIDDLCRRMQASDPCEPTLSTEFRTQRQTEFLLEAFRLQHRATETGQKLMALQTETGKSYYGDGDEVEGQAKLTTRRCFDSIKNNLKDIQRNLEIWLARIIGDLEGILARDGTSRARDYYISRYPFVK